MTVHPMRPPRTPKPPKREQITVDRSDGGLEIRIEPTPATVTPFPKK